MRTLHFEQIADSRFTPDIDKEIERLKKGVSKQLSNLNSVTFEVKDNNTIDFDDGTKQNRVDFYVKKTRATTWNDIYGAVNSIQPVPYKFL